MDWEVRQPWKYGNDLRRFDAVLTWKYSWSGKSESISYGYFVRNEVGKILAQADETVSDLNYLLTAVPAYPANDPLRYEKALLKRWFETRIIDLEVR